MKTEPKQAPRRTVERYFAVRIGNPRTSHPYFMLSDNNCLLPELFISRSSAQSAIDKRQPQSPTIVRVKVTTY